MLFGRRLRMPWSKREIRTWWATTTLNVTPFYSWRGFCNRLRTRQSPGGESIDLVFQALARSLGAFFRFLCVRNAFFCFVFVTVENICNLRGFPLSDNCSLVLLLLLRSHCTRLLSNNKRRGYTFRTFLVRLRTGASIVLRTWDTDRPALLVSHDAARATAEAPLVQEYTIY